MCKIDDMIYSSNFPRETRLALLLDNSILHYPSVRGSEKFPINKARQTFSCHGNTAAHKTSCNKIMEGLFLIFVYVYRVKVILFVFYTAIPCIRYIKSRKRIQVRSQ